MVPEGIARPLLVLVIALAAGGAALAAVLLTRTQPAAPPAARSPAASPSAVSATPTPTATPRGADLVVIRFGAVGDGVHDDTAAVARALSRAAATGRRLYFPGGTYLIGTLELPAGVELAGAGRDRSWLQGRLLVGSADRLAGLKLGAAGAALRFAPGAAGVRFRRCAFVGGGGMSAGEDEGVIRFSAGRSAHDISFIDCLIGANSADGNGVSLVDQGWSGGTYRDISFTRCRFAGSPRMTVECILRADPAHAVTGGYRGIDFTSCVFAPAGSEVLSFDSDVAGAAGFGTIRDCVFQGSGTNLAYPWGQGIEFNGVTGMRFTGNTVHRCRGAMINHQGVSGTPTRNVFDHNTFDGTVSHIRQQPAADVQTIYFVNVSGASFVHNTVINDTGAQLLYMAGCRDCRFADTTFTDARTGDAARACAWITTGTTRTSFTRVRFATATQSGAVVVHDGATGTTLRDCVFVVPGGPPLSVAPGVSVRQLGTVVE